MNGYTPYKQVSEDEIDALKRLISIAERDTGQSRRVAGFLLAWWNADACGGFDLTDLWAVDEEIGYDMIVIMKMIKRVRSYPDAFHDGAFKADFQRLVTLWRPHL